MKATGIVRRIDDLGRVVIPKEIRRTLRIREGDPLEIYIDSGGEVVLKKYSSIGELGSFAEGCVQSLYDTTGHVAIMTDRDRVVAVAGASKTQWIGQGIGSDVERAMSDRRTLLLPLAENTGADNVTEADVWNLVSWVVAPIIAEGDAIGAIVLGTTDEAVRMGEVERKLVETSAGFVARQMES